MLRCERFAHYAGLRLDVTSDRSHAVVRVTIPSDRALARAALVRLCMRFVALSGGVNTVTVTVTQLHVDRWRNTMYLLTDLPTIINLGTILLASLLT